MSSSLLHIMIMIMDASVVISAIHRHICHTVNIVNVINIYIYFLYLRLYVNIFLLYFIFIYFVSPN